MVLEFHQVLQVDPGTSGKCTCWGLSANGTLPKHLCTLHHSSQWYSMDIQWYEYVYYVFIQPLLSSQFLRLWPERSRPCSGRGFPQISQPRSPPNLNFCFCLIALASPSAQAMRRRSASHQGRQMSTKSWSGLIRFKHIQVGVGWNHSYWFISLYGFVWK